MADNSMWPEMPLTALYAALGMVAILILVAFAVGIRLGKRHRKIRWCLMTGVICALGLIPMVFIVPAMLNDSVISVHRRAVAEGKLKVVIDDDTQFMVARTDRGFGTSAKSFPKRIRPLAHTSPAELAGGYAVISLLCSLGAIGGMTIGRRRPRRDVQLTTAALTTPSS